MGKQYVDGKNGLKVKLIESSKKGKTKLAAYIVDPVTLTVLSKTPKTCTFEREEDRTARRNGLINKACTDWTKKHRPKTEKPQNLKVLAKTKARITFEELDWDSPIFTQRWGAESTRQNARVFFERNVLKFVEQHQEEECTRADVEEFHSALVENALRNGHTKGNAAKVRSKMNQHLNEAELIYSAMQMACPELANIDFSPFAIGRTIQSETAKSLPESVRQRFARYLEKSVSETPEYVFAAVLMFDAALRTAEAAGQTAGDIDSYDKFGVVRVRIQEKDGEKCPLLKSDSAYRNVTLSYWGKTLIHKCTELLKGRNEEDPYLIAKQLRNWITRALFECGITEEFMQAARKLMDEEPDMESNGLRSKDIIAYILRKDCCSRWLNICALQSKDVDYLLGHKMSLSYAHKANYKTIAYHQLIASSLENYIYDNTLSAHPFFEPIIISTGEKKEVPPAGAVSIERRDDGKGITEIYYSAREVGAMVELRVPKGCVPKVKTQVLPRRAQQNLPVIGRQVGSVLPKEGGLDNG